jgi:DNA-binding SARP family transcriptional activator
VLGRHDDAVAAARAVVAEHPLREDAHAELMLALYRSGRQSEALEAYRATRRLLAAELGLDPGPRLRDLERRILARRQLDAAHRAARPEAARLRRP